MTDSKFLLFHGAHYYPSGGWGDFGGSFGSIDECKDNAHAVKHFYDWAQIVSVDTMSVVLEGSRKVKLGKDDFEWSAPEDIT